MIPMISAGILRPVPVIGPPVIKISPIIRHTHYSRKSKRYIMINLHIVPHQPYPKSCL